MLEASQLDVMREICNIGSGNASSALAQMMNTKVDIGVPLCEIIPFSEMTKGYESPEEIIVSTVVQISGDMEGFVMMNMPVPAACELLTVLTGEALDANNLPYAQLNEKLQPISEIGNILIGAYLSALSSMSNMTILPSVPMLAVDMVMAVMNLPAVVYGQVGEQALYMDTEFMSDTVQMKGQYYLVSTIESYNRLLSALGM